MRLEERGAVAPDPRVGDRQHLPGDRLSIKSRVPLRHW
jgi:hypothetical protein